MGRKLFSSGRYGDLSALFNYVTDDGVDMMEDYVRIMWEIYCDDTFLCFCVESFKLGGIKTTIRPMDDQKQSRQ